MRRRLLARHGVRGCAMALVALLAVACGGSAGPGPAEGILLGVTTSTHDSGLVDVLVPAFERRTGRKVKTIVAGSGQALEMARRGELDVVLAHSPSAERRLVASGVAGARRPVMYNDFLLVGPRGDPARVAGRDVTAALGQIAAVRAPFVSRGDDSGTHVAELAAWRRAGVVPEGPWYSQTGQGQSATLQIAAERGGYALTDRATYLAVGVDAALPVVVDRGPGLANPYHVIDLTRRAGPRVNAEGGRAFADWLVSAEAQRLIGRFGRAEAGHRLFVPDAAPPARGGDPPA